MCGIIYCKRNDNKPAHKLIEKRYHAQKSRGQEGFGYLAINSPAKLVRHTTEKNILEMLRAEHAPEILFHHRYPTSTPNITEMAHPLVIEGGTLKHRYYIAHNGVIQNDDELKAKHEKLGFAYSTIMQKFYRIGIGASAKDYFYPAQFNDSEAFGIERCRVIEKQQDSIEAKGASAFVAMRVNSKDMPEMLYYGRNEQNPLHIERNKDFCVIASEGHGTSVTPHKLYSADMRTNEITERDILIGERTQEHHAGYMCSCPSCRDHWAGNYGYIGGYRYGKQASVPRDWRGDRYDDEDDIDMEYLKLQEQLEEAEQELQLAEDYQDPKEMNGATLKVERLRDKLEQYENKHAGIIY